MTYYDLLGVTPAATPAELFAAYQQRRTPMTPPDQLAELDAAWATLVNPQSRQEYDRTLAAPPSYPGAPAGPVPGGFGAPAASGNPIFLALSVPLVLLVVGLSSLTGKAVLGSASGSDSGSSSSSSSSGFSSGSSKSADTAAKADLKNIATAEETLLVDTNSYGDLPTIIANGQSVSVSPGVTVTVVRFDGSKGYCLSAQARTSPNRYFYDSQDAGLLPANQPCPATTQGVPGSSQTG